MKQLSKFAALAALVLPLMVACNPKNDPDAPKNPQDEFKEWIDKGSENEVTVSEKNLCGIWQLVRHYSADAEQNYINSQNFDVGNYLEIINDNTFVDHVCDIKMTNSSNMYGTWDLVGKQASFKYKEDNVLAGGFHPTLEEAVNPYMVFRCEPEELALSYTSQGNLHGKNGSDSTGIITTFIVFKRLYELPKIPTPLNEVIIGTPWKVLSDTMYLGKYVTMQTDGFYGDVFQPVKVEQVNMLPKDAVITFAADSTVEVKAANGDVIGKGRYDNRGTSEVPSLLPETHMELWIDIQDEDGNGGYFYGDQDIIPGLPKSLHIFIDPSNDNRVVMHFEEQLPESEVQGELTTRGWVYHLE